MRLLDFQEDESCRVSAHHHLVYRSKRGGSQAPVGYKRIVLSACRVPRFTRQQIRFGLLNMTDTSSPFASVPAVELSSQVTIQPPLSRCGHGPGLILIRPLCYATCQQRNKTLDPEPLKKWAEESFTVAQITMDGQSGIERASVEDLIHDAEDGLSERPECDSKGKIGLIGTGLTTE